MRLRMDPAQRKEQVLAVAAKVFAEKGYRAANVTDIVTGAGIGRGTFYLYFDSKQGVFLAIIEKYFSDLVEMLAENRKRLDTEILGGGGALGTWRGNILRILEYHRDNPDMTSIIYRDALGSDEHFASRVAELNAIANRQLLQEFRSMKKAGMLRECNLELVVTIIMGSVINVIMQHIVGGEGPALEGIIDELMAYHVRALIRPDGEIARALSEATAGPKAKKRKA